MDEKLAKNVLNQMDLCTKMVMQQNEIVKKWDAILAQWDMTAYVERVRRRFPVMDVDSPDLRYVRVGRPHDGGYVMVDDFSDTKTIYSCGINDDVSWDLDMTTRSEADIYMYDHTIDGLPQDHVKFHFFRTGITGIYDQQHPELETLPRLLEKNGHKDDYNILLKMDIEGSEYGVFSEIDRDTLLHFSQIVIEFHSLFSRELENVICYTLDRLNATHQLVHVHANNCDAAVCHGGKMLPKTLEATYLRKNRYQFKKSDRFFPTEIDQQNTIYKPEIILGYWGTE